MATSPRRASCKGPQRYLSSEAPPDGQSGGHTWAFPSDTHRETPASVAAREHVAMQEKAEFADGRLWAEVTGDLFLMFGYTCRGLRGLFTYFQACVIVSDCEAADQVSACFFPPSSFFLCFAYYYNRDQMKRLKGMSKGHSETTIPNFVFFFTKEDFEAPEVFGVLHRF